MLALYPFFFFYRRHLEGQQNAGAPPPPFLEMNRSGELLDVSVKRNTVRVRDLAASNGEKSAHLKDAVLHRRAIVEQSFEQFTAAAVVANVVHDRDKELGHRWTYFIVPQRAGSCPI